MLYFYAWYIRGICLPAEAKRYADTAAEFFQDRPLIDILINIEGGI